MLKARSAFVSVLICCAVFAVPASAATTIGAQPQPDPAAGGYLNCPWGSSDATSVALVTTGQTVVVPSATDTVLDSFSFYVAQLTDPFGQFVGGPEAITYKAYVGKWDGQTVTETVWQSAPQTVTTSPDPAQWETTVQTGGLQLEPGQQYALYFSTDETYASNTVDSRGCSINSSGNNYADGGLLMRGQGTENTNWQWSAPEFGSGDAAFNATFSAPAGGGGEEPVYTFDGFYNPVNNKDAQGSYILNKVNAGRAIPVKFSLGGDYGLDVFEAGYPKSQVIECDAQAEVDGIEETVTAGQSSLSYSADTDTYNYVWKTEKSWEDTCRQLVVKFDDGTTARANFKFQ